MIISHKYKFIFIKTQKSAGTSIEVYLSSLCGPEDILTPIEPPVPPHKPRNYAGRTNPVKDLISTKGGMLRRICFDFLHRRKFYNHIPASLVRSRIPMSVWKSYYKFCVERNPWDKILSQYHMLNDRSKGSLDFDQFIKNGNLPLNYPLYTERGGKKIVVDRVLRYELLTAELGEVFHTLHMPFDGSLHAYAKQRYLGDTRPYQEIFSFGQRQLIEKAFEKEIALFGYRF